MRLPILEKALIGRKVLPDVSSAFGRREFEKLVPIEENHMNICRFKSASDPGYENFKATLTRDLARIAKSVAKEKKEQAVLKTAAIRDQNAGS